MSNGLVALGGLAVAFGLPAYYVVNKKLASDSLNKLLAERFHERPCPVDEVHTKLGTIHFFGAYNDTGGSGLVLVLGNLVRIAEMRTFAWRESSSLAAISNTGQPANGPTCWLPQISQAAASSCGKGCHREIRCSRTCSRCADRLSHERTDLFADE